MLTGSIIQDNIVVVPETGKIYWALRKKRVAAGQEAGVIKHGSRSCGGGYRVICINGQKYRAHHLVWVWVYGIWPKGEIDHIDGNRDNNNINNLREASVSQNRTNKARQSNNKSGFKWVSAHQGRFRAEIRRNKKRIFSSLHDTPEEAYASACEAAKRIHGDFFNAG